MRDFILIYVNGKRHEVRGQSVFQPLSDLLRGPLSLTGTKVVCAEGDCGACTILGGRLEAGTLKYRTLNACIQYVYQLDGCHVITVEGLAQEGSLSPAQQAMVDCHGAQCGFCTPGIVVSLTDLACRAPQFDDREMRDTLCGNLCRCTGYAPIFDAARAMASSPALDTLYPPLAMTTDFHTLCAATVEANGQTVCIPASLAEALAFKAAHPQAVPIAGGTDLGVQANKKGLLPRTLLSLSALPELRTITQQGNSLQIGAGATWTEISAFVQSSLPDMAEMLRIFGSLQIRNAGTIGGNIANGSPIADSLPLLYVLNAELVLASAHGERTLNIQDFYHGYKINDLQPDELIVRVVLPLPQPSQTLKLYKVSKREGMDISTFAAALLLTHDRDNNSIQDIRIAFGGVGPTVVRMPLTEAFLLNKPMTDNTWEQAGLLARTEIEPLSDVRGSREYRLLLASNILRKFGHDVSH